MMPFYIACLLGEQVQIETYAQILLQEKDDSNMAVIKEVNRLFFSEEMCT